MTTILMTALHLRGAHDHRPHPHCRLCWPVAWYERARARMLPTRIVGGVAL